jgi:hypothetical protein
MLKKLGASCHADAKFKIKYFFTIFFTLSPTLNNRKNSVDSGHEKRINSFAVDAAKKWEINSERHLFVGNTNGKLRASIEMKFVYLLQLLSRSTFRARFARTKRKRGGSFFGQSPKNEPHSPLFASEASYG